MKKRNLFVIILALFSQVLLFSQQKGTLIRENIDAPSLANSIIGEPVYQPIAVYLPPSYYNEPQKRFPVIYFLIGWSDTIGDFVRGNPDYIPGYVFENSMNSNVTQGRTKEMIMVIINGYNVLQGCFYHNSLVTGNWEDFVVKDVVGHMDKTYRTIPSPDSRAILGTSMGGYGSLDLSMKHPSVFSIGVGYCPGLADPNGLQKTAMFNDVSVINKVINLRNDLAKYSRAVAHQKYMEAVKNYIKAVDWTMMFSLGYGSAFAPDTNLNAPYFDYPYSLDLNNNLVKDTEIYKTYEAGFGNLKKKIELYKDSLIKLKGYTIDYGTNDGNTWIQEGSRYYDTQLTEAGIHHRLMVNNGGHGNLIKTRTENYQLPYCDSLLTFDTIHLSGKSIIEKYTISDQQEEPIIDTINRKISVVLKSTANIKSLLPEIYVSSGAKVFPFQNSSSPYVDFSSDTIVYKVESENGKNFSTWIVTGKSTNKIIPTELIGPTKLKSSLQIYPNPVIDYIFFKSEGSNINKVEIVDMMGHLVLEKLTNSQNVIIERNNISSGTYIVKAYTKNDCFERTLMIK